MTRNVRRAILIQIEASEIVDRVLLVGPDGGILIETQTRLDVDVDPIVGGGFGGKEIRGHHQILPPISINVHDTSTPTVIGHTGNSHGFRHIHISSVGALKELMGEVGYIGAEQVPIPILVRVENGGRHRVEVHIETQLRRHIFKGPVSQIPVQGVGEEEAVVDHPEVVPSVVIVIEPATLERRLDAISDARFGRHISEMARPVIPEEQVWVERLLGLDVIGRDVDIEVPVPIVIVGAQPPGPPSLELGQSPLHALLGQGAIRALDVKFECPLESDHPKVQVPVLVHIDPKHTSAFPGSVQGLRQFETIGASSVQLDRAFRFRQGDVVPPVAIEIRTTQSTPGKTATSGPAHNVLGGDVFQLSRCPIRDQEKTQGEKNKTETHPGQLGREGQDRNQGVQPHS